MKVFSINAFEDKIDNICEILFLTKPHTLILTVIKAASLAISRFEKRDKLLPINYIVRNTGCACPEAWASINLDRK